MEDAAQAFGAGHGVAQVGDVATFSFFPTKNLATFGDGGLITTPRADVADTCRTLRFHGSKDKQTFTQIGYNSRLDELHAAVLRVFLEGVDAWNAGPPRGRRPVPRAGARRARHAAARRRHLPPVHDARGRPGEGTRRRARRPASPAASTTRTPLHRQPVFADLPARDLPVTEACARDGLALPMFPTLTAAQQREVVAAVASARTPA